MAGAVGPIRRRLLAEDLVRLRRSDDQRRYAASQRRGRIDPNPHQIDAVVFALRRIPEGGCILADEVGLGKTIDAGLIVSQLMAEGKRRILLIVPKSLLGLLWPRSGPPARHRPAAWAVGCAGRERKDAAGSGLG